MSKKDNLGLDEIISSLSNNKTIIENIQQNKELLDSDIEFKSEVIQNLKECIELNREMMSAAKELADSVGDAEFFEAYSSIAKSTSDLLKVWMGLVIEEKKQKAAEKLKERDIESKKELIKLKAEENKKLGYLSQGDEKTVTNNTFIVASRDDIFKSIFGKTEEERVKAQEKIAQYNNIVIEGEKKE